mmetsp:Transcript_6812/g.12478  ORF Transcript_6812/g.12478 Transcript_6812/m.12478 type:complete len:89 (-) Transcript_6812:762-1028(-)
MMMLHVMAETVQVTLIHMITVPQLVQTQTVRIPLIRIHTDTKMDQLVQTQTVLTPPIRIHTHTQQRMWATWVYPVSCTNQLGRLMQID